MDIKQIVAIVSPETAAEMATQAEFNTKLISSLDQKIAEAEAKLAELQATKKSLSAVQFPDWARTFDKLPRIYEVQCEEQIVRITTEAYPSDFRGNEFWYKLLEALQMAGVKLVIRYVGGEDHMHSCPVQFLSWDGTSPFDSGYNSRNFPIVEGVLEWEPLPTATPTFSRS